MQRSPRAFETRYILACGVATSITAAWAALLVLNIGGDSASRTISNVGLIIAAFAGATGCLFAASRGDAHRRTWIFLACASISWGLGQLIWTAYESYGEEVPFPSYADAGYLGLPPLAAIGLLLIPSAIQTLAGRIRTVIDGMMIAGAVFLCSWVVVLDQVYAAGDGGLFTTTISLAYPLGDVVLISIAMYVLLRGRERRDQIIPIWMIVLGLSAFAVADSAFAHLGAPAQSAPGSVIAIGWFVCFVAIMLAGLRPPPVVPDSRVEPEDTRTLGLLLPYVAVGLALVTSSIEIVHTGQTDKVVSWCRMFIIAAMVVRQVLTLSENRSLTRHLEERLVELRGSEQRFQSLVQHSSDVVTVIDVDGIVLYQSESIDRVFGFPVDAVSGNSIKMLLDEESARQLERAVREIAAESYGIRVLDLRVCKASGQLCQVEMTMTNLLNNPSVGGIVLNTRDVSERKMLEDQLVYSAFHDSLTTLANRALFRDRVEDTLETAGRDGIAVLFLDLDSFKQVNDLLGHASGDLLLVQVAERLRHSVRPGDTVARLGGDEFAVLLEGADDATAVDVAERITNALQTPFVVDGQEILVRGSLGLAIASADARSADKLLRNADLAMYRAKAAGEGGFERYDPEMHVHLVERLQLEVDLRRAIEGNELVLHYQPIVEIATGRISGVETLARWRHPTRGLLAAVVVHPDRGGQRVDRRTRQLGPAGGVLPGECLAFDVRIRRAHGQRQHLGGPAQAGISRADRRVAPGDAAAGRMPGARDDGVGAHGSHRGKPGVPHRLQGPGCAPRDRRFRHRLLVAQLPPPLPGRRAQDRPLVRRGAQRHSDRAGARGDDRAARTHAAHADRRRGCGDGDAGTCPRRDGL